MGLLYRSLAALALAFSPFPTGLAQPSRVNGSATGSRISGNVTVDGKPAAGVAIVLFAPASQSSEKYGNFAISSDMGDIRARAVSDTAGTYAFNDLTAGHYIVFPVAPGFSAPASEDFISPGKPVSLASGESVDGIDFPLGHGGVITGRVTRSNDQPAIQVPVQVQRSDENDDMPNLDMATGENGPVQWTDDRGVYRIYGLSPGKYRVSTQAMDAPLTSQPFVYFPGVTDREKAENVTVSEGQETDGIDISLGNAPATYEADGQALDDTGKPVAGAMYGHSAVSDNGQIFSLGLSGSETTDSNGRFSIKGLTPGRYSVFLAPSSSQPLYSDPAYFTISSSDVTGIHLAVHNGATITGIITLTGNPDPGVIGRLSEVTLDASEPINLNRGNPGQAPYFVSVHPSADGSFQLSGLPPGPLRFRLDQSENPQGFSLLQVTQNGVPQPNGITVGAGDQIIGVQVQLIYGTGIIHGQVKLQAGQLPPGTQVYIAAQILSGDQSISVQGASADARGAFQLDNLPDGQYRLIVKWEGESSEGSQSGPIVTVSGGQAPEQIVILNLGQ